MNTVFKSRTTGHRLLLAAVLVVLASSFGVSRIQSAGGEVRVTGINIPTQNGQWVAGDLFKPRSATAENPAPLIVVVQYVTFWRTGTVFWTDGWLYVNLLFAVVPMMFVLPYFNRYFFRLTGRIYMGPMTTCLVFVMILLSNTVVYLPLD